MAANPAQTVLLTGATGFVGQRLLPELRARGWQVRCASRDPERARARQPDVDWVRLDLDQAETVPPAVAGCHAAFFLVHAMGDDDDYAEREAAAARGFAQAAADAGLERIIYLGGVAPQGTPSRHLASRLRTGALLRAGSVPCVELRAGMIVGLGSESWRIVRDLAVRLPAMVLPRWLASRSQPVAIEDVVYALAESLELDLDGSTVLDLPGPEVLSASEILVRVARLRGVQPVMVGVPLVTPWLSSWWIKLVTRADFGVARELVEGLASDLVVEGEGFWALRPAHRRTPFDDAAARALADEVADLRLRDRLVERTAQALSRRAEA